MGGDEFCVLATLMADGPEALAAPAGRPDRAWRGLRDHGLARHGDDPARGRERRRGARHGRPAHVRAQGPQAHVGRRQATDALLRALAERNPDLGAHLDDVTGLCEAVGRELGLPDEEMTPLLQAAALHDVGKVAIPDAILDKPAPLDEAEWEFMRTHTLIGERILAEAPSLPTRRRSSGRATSATTARATRTASPAMRSRSPRGSSPSATRSTR